MDRKPRTCRGRDRQASNKMVFDWKRIFFILLGLALFFAFYFMGDLPDAVDPAGKHFPLPSQVGCLGLFLMAQRGDLRGPCHRRHRHRHWPFPVIFRIRHRIRP